MDQITHLRKTALQIRKRLLQLIYEAKGGHTGGSLSSVDILTALYFDVMNIDHDNPKKEDRDRFILSKGHSVEGYFCVLSARGFFSDEILSTYGKFKSLLAGHPTIKVPGVEVNSGALGHGLSVGVGMALAANRDKKAHRVYVLMGDGEQGEGSIMEAVNAAGHYKLDNLTAIIDRNRLQISGNTEDVMALDSLEKRWASYGWHTLQINGNNMEEIVKTLHSLPIEMGKPHLIVANTTKGKGVSFIENLAVWHHKVPNKEELEKAMTELNNQLEEI